MWNASSRFQQKEGPSRGILRDCENLAEGSFMAQCSIQHTPWGSEDNLQTLSRWINGIFKDELLTTTNKMLSVWKIDINIGLETETVFVLLKCDEF